MHGKLFRTVRFAFLVALAVFALLALCTGNLGGVAALASGAILGRDDLENLLTQIFNTADGAGQTKEEMREALDEIADLADPGTEVEQGKDGTWSVVESDDGGEGEGADDGDGADEE